ncbi:MAG: hypothetical protein MUE40_15885 [Anaerolineae bacterium]|jgi:hypothetical protein|nr:hypothetical protein [Anaerolineae bacterium]
MTAWEPAAFAALVQALAGRGLVPVADAESGWWTAATGGAALPWPATLEEFFTGNPGDGTTFAPGLPQHPGEAALAQHFARLRARPDVVLLAVGVTEVAWNGSEQDRAVAEALYLITSADPARIAPEAVAIQTDTEPAEVGRGWFGRYFPDSLEALDEQPALAALGLLPPPPGCTLYILWWS